MKGQYDYTPKPCPHNITGNVLCGNMTDCWRCGWNPMVAERRMERMAAQGLIPLPVAVSDHRGAEPTEGQRYSLRASGLNPKNWIVVQELEYGFVAENRFSGYRKNVRNKEAFRNENCY